MYRKSMEVPTEELQKGSQFIARLSEIPISKLALSQLSTVYERAQEQRLLAFGLKAGEETFHIASWLASPLVRRLPVASLDSMACRQLEWIEQTIPVIKKDPKELAISREKLVAMAMAPCYNTVDAIRQLSNNTISSVKTLAIETTAPTVEIATKAANYGKETIKSVKDGVYSTYGTTKESVSHLCTTEGIKTSLNTTYTSVRNFDYSKVRELNLENVRENLGRRKEQLVGGVVSGANGIRSEVGAYANATMEPTLRRVNTAKEYGVSKVNDTVTGMRELKDRVVGSMYDNVVVNSFSKSINGALDFAEHSLDYYLPIENEEDECDCKRDGEIHPASADAGSWSRSMRLMSNLRQRTYGAGTREYTRYKKRTTELVQRVSNGYVNGKETITNAYTNSYNYVAATYDSTKKRLEQTKSTIVDFHGAVQRNISTAQGQVIGIYVSTRNGWNRRHEILSDVNATMWKQFGAGKTWVIEAWTHPTESFNHVYISIKSTASTSQEYAMKGYRQVSVRVRQGLHLTGNGLVWVRKTADKTRIAFLDTWNVTSGRLTTFYNFTSELALFVVDKVQKTPLYEKMVSNGVVKEEAVTEPAHPIKTVLSTGYIPIVDKPSTKQSRNEKVSE